jgi:3-deoxy-D-manno-octulosonate 8-phosphate phosphatase (KDO 8-P phosphatase)
MCCCRRCGIWHDTIVSVIGGNKFENLALPPTRVALQLFQMICGILPSPFMATHPTQRIKLLCLDVDGVMTDGGIRIDDHGIETKRFHVRDGTGIRMWLALGNHIAIITGRSGQAVRHRARELGIEHVVQGSGDKQTAFHDLLEKLGLAASQAAMLGDDLPDIPVMLLSGYPMAVADAAGEVRELAAFVTGQPGGHGAVREAIEHILRMRDEWDEAMAVITGRRHEA